MADEFCLKIPHFHVTFRDLLHAVNLRHGTNGFTSLPKGGVLRIFSPCKYPTASVGFEPAYLCTKGQHAPSRPSKPLNEVAAIARDLLFGPTATTQPSNYLAAFRFQFATPHIVQLTTLLWRETYDFLEMNEAGFESADNLLTLL